MRISFQTIKESISLKDVANDYGIQLRKVGGELIGPCPLHGGDNPTAFHLNPVKNRWTCFTRCGHGDIIDFISLLKGCSLKNAAILLAENYRPELLVSQHPFFTERNFDEQEILHQFGIKYQERGLWYGMVTIPLHNRDGAFVGYLGRRVTRLEWGKFKIQKGLQRSKILFNLHRVDLNSTLFVVEGPFDVVRLYQAGYANAVALLGSQFSDFHYEVLKNAPLILLLDQDEAGNKVAHQIKKRIKQAVKIDLPEKDPAEMSAEKLRTFLQEQGFRR